MTLDSLNAGCKPAPGAATAHAACDPPFGTPHELAAGQRLLSSSLDLTLSLVSELTGFAARAVWQSLAGLNGERLPTGLCDVIPKAKAEARGSSWRPSEGQPGGRSMKTATSPPRRCLRAPRLDCRTCQRSHWGLAREAGSNGHLFRGECGATRLWIYLQTGGLCGITLVLESDRAPPRPVAESLPDCPPCGAQNGTGFEAGAVLLRLIARELEARVAVGLSAQRIDQLQAQLSDAQAQNQRFRRQRWPASSTDTAPEAGDDPAAVQRLPLPLEPLCPTLATLYESRATFPRSVQVMLDRLLGEYCHPLSLKELAAELGRNPSYLSTLFRHTTGQSFRQCLCQLRMARAGELLANPSLTVREVAFAVGFATPHEFRVAFRRHIGLAPRDWRLLPRPTTPSDAV